MYQVYEEAKARMGIAAKSLAARVAGQLQNQWIVLTGRGVRMRTPLPRLSTASAHSVTAGRAALRRGSARPPTPTHGTLPKCRYIRRNRIEITFGGLEDWRRVATRYDGTRR